MLTVLLRTIIIYIILLGTMRILGKRQLGELEVSELITTFLLSEIASMPIANQDIPLAYAVIPLITIMTFEVGASLLISKYPKVKTLLASPPSILIYKGRIDQKELLKNRISSEELLSELRLKNITDPTHVEYAVLEQNGLLSVIPKIKYQQATLEELQIEDSDDGIVHIIISQGKWNEYNLKLLGRKKEEFEAILKRKRTDIKDVFLLTVDDSGNRNLVIKECKK
ncbi:MAG: DUF421 domain-containing protein [Eubacteriales bacterium]